MRDQGRFRCDSIGACVPGALALAAAVAVVYWPGLRSFPEGDDFSLLAYARILRNPFALFVHEHFPLGPYFRPLALAVWWASAQVFGNALAPQYALNLLLHCAVVIALWRLLRTLGGGAGVAAGAALAFGAHPAAIGTALWLANRFDLLATLFGLLAFDAAWRARRTGSVTQRALAVAGVLAALLSKETGVIIALLVALVLAWTAGARRERRRADLAVAALSACLGSGWLLWRLQAMHAAPDALGLEDHPAGRLFGGGAAAWVEDLAAYAGAWGRIGTVAAAAAATGVVLLAAGRWVAADPRPLPDADARAGGTQLLVACIVLIVGASCALSAPYAAIWSVPFAPTSVPASIAGYARLFYLPLAAIAVAAAAALDHRERRSRWSRVLGMAGAAALIAAWGSVAHDLANAYRRQSNLKRPLIAAAVGAVANAPLPAGTCRIFLLADPQATPEYLLKTSADAVIKALAPDARRIERCLIQSEQASWANTIGGAVLDAAAAWPWRPMSGHDGPVPWIAVGGVQVAFLNLASGVDPRTLTGAVFLQRRGDRFDDVTARVLDGSQPVRFACARAPAQCGDPR